MQKACNSDELAVKKWLRTEKMGANVHYLYFYN